MTLPHEKEPFSESPVPSRGARATSFSGFTPNDPRFLPGPILIVQFPLAEGWITFHYTSRRPPGLVK